MKNNQLKHVKKKRGEETYIHKINKILKHELQIPIKRCKYISRLHRTESIMFMEEDCVSKWQF